MTVSQDQSLVRFTAPVESAAPGSNLQKELEIRLDERARGSRLEHRVTNRDSRPTELAPWAPTMMKAGGRAILPLPPRAAMDKDHFQSVGPLTLWSFTDFADSRWTLGTEYVQLQQQRNPTGRFPEQMTGIYNPAGWGAYFLNGTVFVKTAPVITRRRCIPTSDAISKCSLIPIFSNLRPSAQRFSWIPEKALVTRKAGHSFETFLRARTTPGFAAR